MPPQIRKSLSPAEFCKKLHYEFEFIHPFADGNGRLGRLWQTLILSHWKPLLAFLPVETVVRDRQDAYYQALASADYASDASPFVDFMLRALLAAIREATRTDQVTDQVTDQAGDQVTDPVKQLLAIFQGEESLKAAEMLHRLALQHRPTFRKNYLQPALAGGWIAMTQPESPTSPAQKYRLTASGLAMQRRNHQA